LGYGGGRTQPASLSWLEVWLAGSGRLDGCFNQSAAADWVSMPAHTDFGLNLLYCPGGDSTVPWCSRRMMIQMLEAAGTFQELLGIDPSTLIGMPGSPGGVAETWSRAGSRRVTVLRRRKPHPGSLRRRCRIVRLRNIWSEKVA